MDPAEPSSEKNSFTLEMIDVWKVFLEKAAADIGVGVGVGAIVLKGNGCNILDGADLDII